MAVDPDHLPSLERAIDMAAALRDHHWTRVEIDEWKDGRIVQPNVWVGPAPAIPL